MRTLPCFSRRARHILLLVALCVALAAPQCLAADNPQPLPSLQAADTADFLATLSAAVPGTLQVPAPTFLTGCGSGGAQCPVGKLCCLACGYAGCDTYACFTPVNGHCPLIP